MFLVCLSVLSWLLVSAILSTFYCSTVLDWAYLHDRLMPWDFDMEFSRPTELIKLLWFLIKALIMIIHQNVWWFWKEKRGFCFMVSFYYIFISLFWVVSIFKYNCIYMYLYISRFSEGNGELKLWIPMFLPSLNLRHANSLSLFLDMHIL